MMASHIPSTQAPRETHQTTHAARVAQRIANQADATYSQALEELRSLALRQGVVDGRQIAASAWPDLAPLAAEPAPTFALALDKYATDLYHGGGAHRARGRGRYLITRRRGSLTPEQERELRRTLEVIDTLATAGATLQPIREAGAWAVRPDDLIASPEAAVRFFTQTFARASWGAFVEWTLAAQRGNAVA